MSDTNITSKNQSGGITAQNVSSNTTVNSTEAESKPRRVFWWIFGILGGLGAIAAIVTLFMGG